MKRISVGSFLVLVLAFFVFRACGGDSVAPFITASDQTLADLTTLVVVEAGALPQAGWVVIHEDDAGDPGDPVGQLARPAGAFADLAVGLDRPALDGETLHAVLHEDAGVAGTFEPLTDLPLEDAEGNPVAVSFTATVTAGIPDVRLNLTASGTAFYQWSSVEPPSLENTLGSEPNNETLFLETGYRYEIVNSGTGTAPFELVNLADSIVLLSEAGAGTLEADGGIDWEDDGNGTLRFTFTATLEDSLTGYWASTQQAAMRGFVGAGIRTEDQTLSELSTIVTIAGVAAVGPTWIAVYDDDGGGNPNNRIGAALLAAGSYENEEVELTRAAVSGETLHAQLHADAGVAGTFEPGTDAVLEDGLANLFRSAFGVTVAAGTPAVRLQVSGVHDIFETFYFNWTSVTPSTFSDIIGSELENQTVTLTEGTRYEIVNSSGASEHPLEFITGGAPDTVLLSQELGVIGSLEGDGTIGWVETTGATVRFTASASFVAATDMYRCGIHSTSMRGDVNYTP
ncbi:MAG: hypothetical protein AB1405_08315 [Bdellovibrionota bacterium]